MHFSMLAPLVALASLATAQVPLATFSALGEERFDITTPECTNFQRTQPIYEDLLVYPPNRCILYASRNCEDPIELFGPGRYYIEDLQFRSVQCEREQ
ncbi:hypothetical protein V493_05299 [Pseudogymnoascus sp. VKM F-4281 (FW-2241)]|nr:hypothetical protein V493_05299 [Pseudogymnoascus sp. VKM F-4281 (FW-2241)]